ncbi:MAG: putative Ig domain-containing protein [Planctomycetes bacterium]|nr:putative Ig domain-containing protein [Planctomycetota bacterium]
MRFTRLQITLLAATVLLGFAAGCGESGGGGSSGGSTTPSALTITTTTMADATLGQPYSEAVRAVGGTNAGYSWAIVAGALPAGLNLSPSGTPTASVSGTATVLGTFNFTVEVTDMAGATATAALQLDVVAGTALAISTTSLPDGTEYQSYSQAVTATGGSGSGYTWSILIGSLPPGLSLAASGTPASSISGTPNAAGTYNFTVQVEDSAALVAQAALQIVVLATPLSITTAAAMADGTTTVAYSQPITATGGSFSGYAWAVTGGEFPPGLALGASGTPGTTISGTPTVFGRFDFTVEVTDSAANTASLAMTLIVVVAGNSDTWVASFNLEADLGGTAVFTGSKILQFGGEFAASNEGHVMVPGAGTSTLMTSTGAPPARTDHTAVWTGSRMIVFGGRDGSTYFNDTYSYDPVGNAWTTLSASGAPGARALHTAVWTGSEMIVFGGHDAAQVPFKDGAAYDPSANTWRALSAAPGTLAGRERHKAVWGGSMMLVWGGFDDAGNDLYDGATYDPVGDTWGSITASSAPNVQAYQSTVVWTGSELFVWGGNINAYMDGATWDPVSNTWTAIGTWAIIRRQPAAVATSDGVFVWGGLDHFGTWAQNDGEFFDYSMQNWVTMATPSLGGRFNAKAFWTGRQIIVWGGKDFGFAGTNPQSNGELYNP